MYQHLHSLLLLLLQEQYVCPVCCDQPHWKPGCRPLYQVQALYHKLFLIILTL
jgi:hypothetical protein